MTGPAAAAPTVPAVGSTAVASLLVGPPRPVLVLAAFPAAVYLATEDGTVVTLVSSDGVHHPNALALTEPASDGPLLGYRPHQRGTIGDGELVLAGRRTVVRRWLDPVPRVAATTPCRLHAAAGAAQLHLALSAGPAPVGLTDGVAEVADALAAGDVDDAVAAARGLVGLGPGLTPAGDDVLAGLLSGTLVLAGAVRAGLGLVPGASQLDELDRWVRDAGAAIAAHARRATTSVSAALLAHAARGEVCAPAGVLLHTLCGRGDVPTGLRRLVDVGATSGRDLTVGLLAAADLVVTAAPAATGSDPAPHLPRPAPLQQASPRPRSPGGSPFGTTQPRST